jgi:hypothetical protein
MAEVALQKEELYSICIVLSRYVVVLCSITSSKVIIFRNYIS